MQDQQPPPNAGMAFIFVASIVGAVIDWRYKRRGGKQPTGKDRLVFTITLLVCAGLGVAVYLFRGASADPYKLAGVIGQIEGLLFDILFALWEFARWRVRRKYPLSPPPLVR